MSRSRDPLLPTLAACYDAVSFAAAQANPVRAALTDVKVVSAWHGHAMVEDTLDTRGSKPTG